MAEIVQAEGWARFRELETLSLKAVTLPNTVIATGGGIVLAEGNRQFMRENGVVIYLQASVSALIDRLEAYPKAEQRPTLTGKPVREEVGEVLAQREALYRTLPTILWMPRPRRIGWWSRLCPCCAARRQPR
ncbi:Shikimate kinase III [Klebsiella pneumoniae subsp. ozaenae]|uniref:Shikimate kinase III n=1 Tax=Klebsiella pneumoniae subsp. ozaenae TaxID=574 RepID=A0A378BX74_KLEPO|nr:Shikimate kinase III [Klebsiella pneumoniae subsp. ozaenae]